MANAGTLPILLITGANIAASCSEELTRALECPVEIAESRKSAAMALRRTEFSVVVIDESLAESDSEGAEQLWRASELAVPVQLNFAICSCARLVRELRAALYRRTQEISRARKAAEVHLQADIGSALTSIVLEMDLLRTATQMPADMRGRLQHVSTLVEEMRKKLAPAATSKSAARAAANGGSISIGHGTSTAASTSEKQLMHGGNGLSQPKLRV
jgi:DNA-binding NtrC family response regulator